MGRGDATLGTRLWLVQKRLQQDRQTLGGPSDPAPGSRRDAGAPSGAPGFVAVNLWFIACSLRAGAVRRAVLGKFIGKTSNIHFPIRIFLLFEEAAGKHSVLAETFFLPFA